MILELCTVGRKTPSDGRLEITAATFRRLAIERASLTATVDDQQVDAYLERLPCTCGRGGGEDHEHTFIRADVFRGLTPGETCAIELTAPGALVVSRPHPLTP